MNGALNAFGSDPEPEIVRHDDYGAHYGSVFGRGRVVDFPHETLIDLDAGERISRQVAQGRVAGTKVIEGKTDALGSQRP